jgi:hypothetical protein
VLTDDLKIIIDTHPKNLTFLK